MITIGFVVVMWGSFYAIEGKNITDVPSTIIASAMILGVAFLLSLFGILKLARISVLEVSAQILPLWSSLTAIGLIIVLIFRLEYSSVFIILNWFVGLALLFAVEKFLRKANNIILAVMPNVDLGEVNQAEVIKIDGLSLPDRPINAVVATVEEMANPLYAPVLAQLAINKIPILPHEVFQEQITGQVNRRHVDVSNLMQLGPYHRFIVIKRFSDIIMAGCGIILLSPLMVVIAVLIRLESSGSPIFIQRRIGEGGHEFNMYKFRSMLKNADVGGAKSTAVDDVRITRVGHLIRKLRIDELPQLINVIDGSMSMIGPRPEEISLVEKFSDEIPLYSFRHAIRPGITGWAQVMQGYAYANDASSTNAKLDYDLYYIKNLSLMMDFVIFFKTIKTIITGFGAR